MEEELEEQEEDIWINIISSAPNNIKITNYFNYEPRFNGVFLRNNLLRIKDGAYVTNLDDKNSKGTDCISLFIDSISHILPSYIPQEVLKKIKDKSITHNIFRM